MNQADYYKQTFGQDYYSRIGKLGGKVKVKKGFAKLDPKRHKELSAKGGRAKRDSISL